jgi:ankyrin repeat protein
MFESMYRNIEIVKELIKADSNINIQNEYGYTALMYTSERKYIKIIKELIKARENINL